MIYGNENILKYLIKTTKHQVNSYLQDERHDLGIQIKMDIVFCFHYISFFQLSFY